MPGKNGKQVYEMIREIRPGIKSLFMSGYSFDILKDDSIEESKFISKPVSPRELPKRIRHLLDGG